MYEIIFKNIYATKDNNLYKSWIVLITCYSSRSTYLDVFQIVMDIRAQKLWNDFLVFMVPQR